MESRRASSASKPTTGEATEAGFVSDLHDVRTGYLLHDSIAQPMRSPLGGCVSGACLACPCYCVVRPFLCVALPRGKWRSAHRRLCSLSMCQRVKKPTINQVYRLPCWA